jgi:UDP-N-acetylmuramoyl-tripeptide--D-alanyl-D-alanine ligase
MNALAACAVSLLAGADLAAVRRGLESLSAVTGRFNIHVLPGEITLIDDSYNANPESLQAALEVLALATDDSWLVLGDMGELGAAAAELHAAAGRRARAAGVTRLYGLGELARQAVAAFNGPGGAFSTMDELLDALRADLCGPLHILVKGSRSMRMERVVAALGASAGDGGGH